jgi:hypothetical protein
MKVKDSDLATNSGDVLTAKMDAQAAAEDFQDRPAATRSCGSKPTRRPGRTGPIRSSSVAACKGGADVPEQFDMGAIVLGLRSGSWWASAGGGRSCAASFRANVNGGWLGGGSEPARCDECRLDHSYGG